MIGPFASETRRFSKLRGAAVVFFLLLFGAVFSWWVVEQTDRRMRDDLLYQVRLAAQTIESEQIRALSGSDDDLTKPEYHALQRRVAALRSAAECRYVYLMRRRPARDDATVSEVVFLVEAQNDRLESSPPSQPGDVYEDEFITDEFAALFDGGTPLVEGPVEDEWGVWVSALAPLFDHKTGELLGVLGMDYDAALWRWNVAANSVLPIGLMFVLLLILIAFVAVSRPVDDSPRPVLRRLLPPILVALLLLTSTAVLLLWREYYAHLEERLNNLHSSVFTEFQLDLKNDLSLMESAMISLAESPRLQRALFDGDKEALFVDWLATYARLRREFGVRCFSFADVARSRIMSFASEDEEDPVFAGYVALKAEETGRIASGVALCPCGMVLLHVVMPVFRGERLVGYAKISKNVAEVLQSRYLRSGSHLALLLRKESLDRKRWEQSPEFGGKEAWAALPDRKIAFSSMERFPPDLFARGRFQEEGSVRRERREAGFQGKTWSVSQIPFEDASGENIGEFAILTDITLEKAHLRRQVALMWGIGGTIAAALLILLVALLRRTDAGILAQQAALRESDALLKKLSKQIPGALYQCRRYPDGKRMVSFVSENIGDICEVDPEEVRSDSVTVFSRVHPEDLESLNASIERSFRTMERLEYEFRMLLPEKGERWLSGMGNPERLPDGSVLWHGYVADCTERRAREEEGKRQAGLISSLLRSIPDIVFYKDPDGAFLGCNPPHEELTGRSEADTVGKTDYDFYDRETADFYRQKDKYALASLHPERNEEWVTYPDGRRALLDTLKTPFWGKDGELIGLLGISRDITERKRMEEDLRDALQAANAANLAKSAFLASMSHEIRTPMNAILGFSQLLERDPELAAGHMQYVRIINRSGEHLLSLINDILDMAKIEADRVTLTMESFNPYVMMTDIGSLFQPLLDQKSLYLNIEHDEALPSATLLGDEGKLRQVLVNLVGNAVKFTREGGVTVRCRLEASSAKETGEGRALALFFEVEDTGVGISAEQSELIFAPFQQSDAGKKAGGTGLGLTISRKFVEMMGGVLAFESEPGRGSCFRFSIPVERGSAAPEKVFRRSVRVRGLKPGGGKATILVADDDDASRRLAVELLTGAGFEAAEAANGREAVELAKRLTPDAVLMDMNMPVLDGYEATRLIKAGAGRRTPVIALTADAFAKEAVAACGADAYLRKPFVADELFAALQEVLGLEYAYDGDAQIEENGAAGPTPDALDLSGVSPVLRRELYNAVEDGDMARIRELIRNISAADASLGEALLLLAERYDYERLLEALNNEGGLSDDE